VRKHWPKREERLILDESAEAEAEEMDGVWQTPPRPKPEPRRPAWATAQPRRSGQGANSEPVADRQELPPWRMLRARPAPPKPAADVSIWPG
jgi:hypothetical protein